MKETSGTARTIPLTNGGEALVDEADFARLSRYRWRRNSGGYAVRGSSKTSVIAMHHDVLPRETGRLTDHANGDRLDNRRENLRRCTVQQNAFNVAPRGGTSSYRGVFWQMSKQAWASRIKAGPVRRFLGLFDSEEEAARAYDAAAAELHGDFARLNFPAAGGAR